MFQFKRDFETDFRAARPVDATRALNPSLQTFQRMAGGESWSGSRRAEGGRVHAEDAEGRRTVGQD